jgi:hypothetical protein
MEEEDLLQIAMAESLASAQTTSSYVTEEEVLDAEELLTQQALDMRLARLEELSKRLKKEAQISSKLLREKQEARRALYAAVESHDEAQRAANAAREQVQLLFSQREYEHKSGVEFSTMLLQLSQRLSSAETRTESMFTRLKLARTRLDEISESHHRATAMANETIAAISLIPPSLSEAAGSH